MKLSHRLIEILDILRHRRRGNRFPRFFNNEGFSPFLDTHLLQEYVHDDQHHNGEKHGVILNLVDFKDDELLIKQVGIQVGVERHFQFSAPVKLFQDGSEVTNGEVDFLQ